MPDLRSLRMREPEATRCSTAGRPPRGAVERPALRVLSGGASNSRPSAKSDTAGVDTVRLRHRDPDARLYERLRRREHQTGARGEIYVQADGCRWGAFPDGLSYVEGRVAAVLDGADAHYLATPQRAVEAAELFADTIGCDVGQVGVGRLDLASELHFDDGREGLALMRAMAALDVPWLKTGTEGSKRDGLETVAWRNVNGRSINFRLYDKGVESETAAPGTRLRGERQRRMRKGRELVAAALPSLDLGSLYIGRELRPFAAADRSVTVCNTLDAVEVLNALARAGTVTRGRADRLAGFLICGRRRIDYTARTWYRVWSELRTLGIALDDQIAEVIELPVSRYVGALADAWAVAA